MPLPQSDTQLHWEESEGNELFNILYAAFQRARRNGEGTIERFYTIGGYTICLRFAGDVFIPIVTPAFNHLVAEPTASPDLTICVWDRVSTGVPMTLLSNLFRYISWYWQEYIDGRGELKGFNSERIRVAFHPGPNSLSLLDHQQYLALYWVDDAARPLPWFETGYPFQKILNWWMEKHHRQFIHASAVGTAEGAVLLTGKGGVGKSTTALACLNSDLMYVGDDYCLASTESSPYLYSLYNTAKLEGIEEMTQRFPHLMELLDSRNCHELERAMLFLYEHFPEKILAEVPLKAIFALKITGRPETTFRPISGGLALSAMAPGTIMQLTGTGQTALRAMAQLVKQVPCYLLEVGTEMSQIPKVILEVLSSESKTTTN
ncbi:MAG: serine kinase [bacterium]|nr:serine kinase [bacterium]